MKENHYKYYFEQDYSLVVTERSENNDILEGQLVSKKNPSNIFPISNGIPRFVDESNYSDNFGLQWNTFKQTQYDSSSGLSLTEKRFWENTKWKKKDLVGKKILEVGSGAGRFTEILLSTGADVVSFDYSNAVDANYSSHKEHQNLFLFQGNIYDIPLGKHRFDYVFCYGVLQHTPDPVRAYGAIFDKVKSGGMISIDYYLKMKKPSVWSTPKYIWRPITRRMSPSLLLRFIKLYIPLYLPIDTFIKRRFKKGYSIAARIPIPCWNYLDFGLSEQQRLEWAVMDTFDALGAKYDEPKTKNEVKEMVDIAGSENVDVFYGSNGVVANVTKV